MKSWLQDNDIEMYLKHNEGKSVAAERLIRTLKNTMYKFMTSVSKNVYLDKLDDIVNKYRNTCHSTIKMKPINVKSSTFSIENNDEDPKFEVGDFIRILIYKNSFAKRYTPNWSEEDFLIKKVKNTMTWA